MPKRSLGRGPATSQGEGDAAGFLESRVRFLGIGVVCAKLALVPVVFDHSSDVPFSVIKASLSHGLAYVLVGVLVALVMRYGRAVLVWSPLHIPVLAFLAANVAATLFAVDQLLALYGAHTRMVGLGTIADGVLLYFAISFLVRSRREALALAVCFFAGAAVVLAYEFVQFVGIDPLTWAADPAPRPFSTIGQTTNLAEYLSVVAVGAAALALLESTWPIAARLFLMTFSLLAVAGAVVTQTRSAVLGLIAAGVVLVALTWTSHPSTRARAISVVGAFGAVAVLVALLLATPLGARFLSTLDTSVNVEADSSVRLEESAETRLALYRIAVEMVRDRPAFGQGPDNFLAALPRFRSDTEPFQVQDNPTSSAHSWLAQTAATSGIIGLTAFLAIVLVALVATSRSGFRPEAWVALGMLAAFLGSAATTVNAIATDWLFWAAVGVIASATSRPHQAGIAAAAEPRDNTQRGKSRARRSSSARALVSYLCIGIGVAVAFSTVIAVDGSRAARMSQLARLQGQVQVAIDAGLRATRLDPQRPQYWDTLGLAYVSAARLTEAAAAFDRAGKLAPYDIRYDGDLARALAAQVLKGDRSAAVRARDVADRVVRADPNNPLAHQTRAVVLQIAGNFPEALVSSERALALDRTSAAGFTENRDIYVTGVQILNSLGRSSEAVTLARRGVARLPAGMAQVPMRVELARSLVASGDLASAFTEVNVALAIRPNDPDALKLRAEIQAALGN